MALTVPPERVIDLKAIIGSASLVALVSVLSALFGAALSAADVKALGFPFYSENNLESAFANSLVFLGLVLLGTLFMLLIIRARRAPLLPVVMAVAVFLSFWGILEIFIAYTLPIPDALVPVAELLSLAVAALTAVLIIKPVNILLLDALLVIYGSMAGALFYSVLPPWSVASIAAVLAIYDLYSVFRGPLKRILESAVNEGGQPSVPSQLRGAVVYVGGLALGMGDVLIYSMLSPLYYLYPSPSIARWALGIIMLLAGFLCTLRMLRKRRFMPALPLPVLMSITAYFAYLVFAGR